MSGPCIHVYAASPCVYCEKDKLASRAAELEIALRDMLKYHGCHEQDYCYACQPARFVLSKKEST